MASDLERSLRLARTMAEVPGDGREQVGRWLLRDLVEGIDAARAEAARYREAISAELIEMDERGVHDIAQRLRAALAHQDVASRVPDGTDGEGGE